MENIQRGIIDKWIRPWDNDKTDNLYDRDERFFVILVKGVLAYLNRNIVLNGKSVNHFIFTTGSSYMYLEKNGYEFSMCETTGEDQMYMKLPRCVCEFNDVTVPQEELSSPYVRGIYDRISSETNKIKSFSAELRRLPLEINFTLHYVLGTFNESIILLEELIDKLVFQRYFNIVYLGQRIRCSIEFPSNAKVDFNKIDMSSAETSVKHIDLQVKICTNYPIINLETELDGAKTISTFGTSFEIEKDMASLDIENRNYD